MNPNQILDHLRERLFVPFCIHLSEGSHYDAPHPEFAAVIVRQVAVAVGDIQETVAEKLVNRDPLHVTRIEPLERKRTGDNGKPKRKKKC